MRTQPELQTILTDLIGNSNVYFQPPGEEAMEYPCIRYAFEGYHVIHADNKKYKKCKRYGLTVIDFDPDSELPDKVLELPYCSFNRAYVYKGLHHFVFTLYF